ncbi:endonuclease/exonuclease/phosphatase family protein [Hydrogenophaga sp.]|uniref:endonuclease/exonuclease/phosphatase family protein n=1 Tax=Hydrogenophaga sp. TaxID=1904254 RepID=UPI002FC6A4DB
MSSAGFSLLTLNSWKCDGHYAQRIGLLAQGVIDLAPDVVALQEAFVAEDGSADTAGRLAAATGLRAVQALARPKLRSFAGRQVPSFSGQAVLTRVTVLRVDNVVLPSSEADGGRMAQVVQLRVGAHPVTVANVHLSHLRGGVGDALRQRQLQAVLEHLNQIGPASLTLVCGDFNDPLEAPALRDFTGAPWHLQDSFELAGQVREPTCVDASGQGQVLDHVLVVPSLSRATVQMTAATVLRVDRPDARGITPSDHSGLQITCRLS